MRSTDDSPWLYVAAWDEAGPIKVGICTKPNVRMGVLRRETGVRKIRCEAKFHCPPGTGRYIELAVHESMEPVALGGEWFAMGLKPAVEHVQATWEKLWRLDANAIVAIRGKLPTVEHPTEPLPDYYECIRRGMLA